MEPHVERLVWVIVALEVSATIALLVAPDVGDVFALLVVFVMCGLTGYALGRR